MAVDLNSFVWASAGVEPVSIADAIYSAGDQPIAGYDNYFNFVLSDDLHTLTESFNDHSGLHENGGEQEIDLDGLSVGEAGDLVDNAGVLQITDGTDPVATVDTTNATITTWPAFNTKTEHNSGLSVGGDVTRPGGGVIYDYTNDEFHRAVEAQNADWADEAGDADTLQGLGPSAFIREGDATVSPTGEWDFTQTVDTDISGNATTADVATVAELAEDSEALEGKTLTEIAEVDVAETVTAAWTHGGSVSFENANFHEFYDSATDEVLDFLATDDTYRWEPAVDTGDHFGYDFGEGYWNFGDGVYIDHDEVATETYVDNRVFEDGLQADQDVTITGKWGYDQQIIGSIEHADWADNADHALEADHATDADHALEADQADEADWASLAENANGSDRVDGYHAQDLIDMMGTGGRWNYIGDWQLSGGVDEWGTIEEADRNWFEIDLEAMGEVFERYRMLLVHEWNADPGAAGDREGIGSVNINLNGDHRRRHYYTRRDADFRTAVPNDPTPAQYHIPRSEIRSWSFRAAKTMHNQRAVCELDISCTDTMGNNVNSFPTVATTSSGPSWDADGEFLTGQLRTNYDRVRSIWLTRVHHGEANLYVRLWGNNIFDI